MRTIQIFGEQLLLQLPKLIICDTDKMNSRIVCFTCSSSGLPEGQAGKLIFFAPWYLQCKVRAALATNIYHFVWAFYVWCNIWTDANWIPDDRMSCETTERFSTVWKDPWAFALVTSSTAHCQEKKTTTQQTVTFNFFGMPLFACLFITFG